MYTLKSIARRSIALGMAVALFAATIVPTASVFAANELNPLTDRSLTLSSGSPGWAFTDGSGNSTYAPPNSGANGLKTGNTFEFKVSTDSSATGVNNDIDAFTFQYCTRSAGSCTSPGDNGHTGASRNADTATTSDLRVATSSPSESTFATHINATSGAPTSIPNRDDTQGNFLVMKKDIGDTDWSASTGWAMGASNLEDGTIAAGTATGRNNYITITNSGTGLGLKTGASVRIIFFATDDNYITNPGSGAFFVKINSYNDNTTQDDSTLVDGGVTVANVMNESIQITTKVLETMDFSVGTVDPYTLEAIEDDSGTVGDDESEDSALFAANGNRVHSPCEPILKAMLPSEPNANRLMLGDEDGEFSLKTDTTYSTHSYWRLSSNSSAGATVYYSGVTLSNTVNDKIDPIYGSAPGDGLAAAPQPGREQFGLALDNGSGPNYNVSYATERTAPSGGFGGIFESGDDNATSGIHASVTDPDISNLNANPSYHAPQLAPLIPGSEYDDGTGTINNNYANGSDPITTQFAFDETSSTIPVPFASQGTEVVDCVTGKMRYIANIAATTPAGIYTTKINYIAAPQY